MAKAITIKVLETDISLLAVKESDYFSLTDIAKRFNPDNPSSILVNWMRNKDTIEFLGTWEMLNNPGFNLIEFDKVKSEAGTNRFILSLTRWIEGTSAIGVKSKSGRYGGGTYAHKDIALAFCYWLSPSFQLYVIKEFQRLKEVEAEQARGQLDWNLKRTLAKVNYLLHTDAVRQHLVPPKIQNTRLEGIYHATEADLLNLALFGMTAKEWRLQNPAAKGNVRDHATAEQLLVLANLENLNAEFIKMGWSKDERLQRLNDAAIYQMQLLLNVPALAQLGSKSSELP